MSLATDPVCRGHQPPGEFLAAWVYDRPGLSLVCGPRGGGKSYLSALATHLDSVRYAGHDTKILGGSESQSMQIFNALKDFDIRFDDAPSDVVQQQATRIAYVNGSTASYIPASAKSVRGPHVPTLRLDEIDEIDADIRESAMGMCMRRRGVPASVSMTSTWHRIGGPMAGLLERGRAGEFPTYTFCAFEVLERCPEERSGKHLEHCPTCPLARWCLESDSTPKAKRSNGHYAIDSLIQKVKAISLRVFEADYLCLGPKADGLYFPRFDPAIHVTDAAEYDPALPVTLAVDVGVFTGAVWFQADAANPPTVRVFADYLSEGLSARSNAQAIRRVSEERCQGRHEYAFADPAGNARNPIGPTVLAEFLAEGLPLKPWPIGLVVDGLELVESFLTPADGVPRLLIHPRCVQLIRAFQGYRRKKRSGQWEDTPEDPQHSAEDMMDALRGGLYARFKAKRVLKFL